MLAITFEIIKWYQQKHHGHMKSLNCTKYQGFSFNEGHNTIQLVTYNDNTVIMQQL